MAKPEMVMIPRYKYERLPEVLKDAKRTSAEFKKRIKELDRQWEEMEERHREDRRRSY